MLTIFVDADACPVKPEIYRVAERCQLKVILVANTWMRVPVEQWIELKVVGDGFDEADDWITEQVEANDIVITSDIILAGRCLKANAFVIGANGKSFNEENIGSALATRELMADLRESGEMTGGPPPFSKKDRSQFLQELDRVIQLIRRTAS